MIDRFHSSVDAVFRSYVRRTRVAPLVLSNDLEQLELCWMDCCRHACTSKSQNGLCSIPKLIVPTTLLRYRLDLCSEAFFDTFCMTDVHKQAPSTSWKIVSDLRTLVNSLESSLARAPRSPTSAAVCASMTSRGKCDCFQHLIHELDEMKKLWYEKLVGTVVRRRKPVNSHRTHG